MDLLDRATQISVERHLRECNYCQTELDDLRFFLGVPNAVKAKTEVKGRIEQRINEWIGTLVTVATPSNALPVLRGTDNGPLVFKAADITVFLQLQVIQKHFKLVGQILDENDERWRGALVKVHQLNSIEAVGIVDDTMGFQCDLRQTGASDVRIIAETGVAIILPHVMLEQ